MNTSKYSDDTIIQTFIDYVQNGLADKVDKTTFPYTDGGSYTFETLPTASLSNLGKVFNVTNDFITTEDFLEGPDIPCAGGTDVAVVRVANTNPVTYKYNIFGGSVVTPGGDGNYNTLSNKPAINGVTLMGNKSAADLGLVTASALPVVPTDVSAFNNDAEYITKSVDDLTNYTKSSDMADVATSGDYSDLSNRPSIPTVDSALSSTSENALQNKVIDYNLGLKQNTLLASAMHIGGVTQDHVEEALSALDTYKVDKSSVGAANGVAELDNTGKVPSTQLPSYVDDVVDGYYNTTDGKFYEEDTYTTEITGEAGKIYISLDTDIQYRWTGSSFAAMGGALTLGETSSTAYRGDRGKIAYDDSQTNKSNIGDLSQLTTDANNNLVEAINEVDATRLASMPSAGVTYAGKIVQYIGATDSTYTQGYFYKCVNNGGTHSWEQIDVQKPRHTVKDGSTDMTARTGLKFVDHDISDDSTNDDTVVQPHELTAAEMQEIVSPLPGKTDNGIIFDERGTEYVVGKYILANGTSKPLYQKTFIGTMPTISSGTYSHKDFDIGVSIDVGIVVDCFIKKGTLIVNPTNVNGNASANKFTIRPNISTTGTISLYSSDDSVSGGDAYITVRYTKSADTPV